MTVRRSLLRKTGNFWTYSFPGLTYYTASVIGIIGQKNDPRPRMRDWARIALPTLGTGVETQGLLCLVDDPKKESLVSTMLVVPHESPVWADREIGPAC